MMRRSARGLPALGRAGALECAQHGADQQPEQDAREGVDRIVKATVHRPRSQREFRDEEEPEPAPILASGGHNPGQGSGDVGTGEGRAL